MDVQNITKIALAWELYREGVPQTHIAREIGVDRVTVYRWVNGIEQAEDLEAFLDGYITAKKGSRRKRKVDGLLKCRIWDLRGKHRGCCGQKIQYFLKRDYGINLGIRQIYEILAEKYVLRTRWKKNQARGPIPQASKPREVIQMDTVDFGDVFAFTGIDIFTREVDALLRPSLTGRDGYLFLRASMTRRFGSRVSLVQTDGGPEFKDEFKIHVLEYAERHRIARPYRKNEQSFIESFNRSLRKECLGWAKYRTRELSTLTKEVETYLEYYHNERPHISLGMKPPNEVLKDQLLHI